MSILVEMFQERQQGGALVTAVFLRGSCQKKSTLFLFLAWLDELVPRSLNSVLREIMTESLSDFNSIWCVGKFNVFLIFNMFSVSNYNIRGPESQRLSSETIANVLRIKIDLKKHIYSEHWSFSVTRAKREPKITSSGWKSYHQISS